MFSLRRVASVLRRFAKQQQANEDLDEEVHSYFELSAEREMAKGLSRTEANRTVRVRFEGPEQVKFTVRESWTGTRVQAIFQDLLYAWRNLKSRPVYAMTAIGTLALGIGANTVIFSVISGVLLRCRFCSLTELFG